MASEFLGALQNIKDKHNEAFRVIDRAVKNEEEENPCQALQDYKKGIEMIDAALAIPVGIPENVESVKVEWEEACKIVHKLKRMRAEVLQRIGILSKQENCSNNSNEDTQSGNTGTTARPRTYSELAQALRTLRDVELSDKSLELIFTCDGVKLYNIKGNGLVTTKTENSTLRVLRLGADERKGLSSTCFIQIIQTSQAIPIIYVEENDDQTSSSLGSFEHVEIPHDTADNFDALNDSSWIYPLLPGVSPCYRTEYGAFIFPDLEAAEPGTAFGIIVPKDNNCDELFLEILEAILHGVIHQISSDRLPKDVPTQVSENIVRGAGFVSQNLIKGAEKAGSLISYSTPYLISKIRGAPPNAAPVSNNVRTTVQTAKNVTGVAASCAGYIARAVADKTARLGKFLAPHVQKQGSSLLTTVFGMEESSANEKMSAALTIAAGAVEGFGTIYSGLEDSAKILGNSLSANSVKIIEHKYGASAGSVAAETFDTVGNVINLRRNANVFKPNSLVKSAAKGAGLAVIRDMNTPQPSNVIPASSLYPNLLDLEKK